MSCLWSGSYMLSWLMAAGMTVLSAEVGPDTVIFSNLRGQALFDLHWREDLWTKVSISGQQSVWKSLAWRNGALLTPNLPNVFLGVVPGDLAADLGRKVVSAVKAEWVMQYHSPRNSSMHSSQDCYAAVRPLQLWRSGFSHGLS